MSDYLNATLRAVTRMLSLPLRQCRRCPCFARPVPGLLQSHATTFEPRCPNAGSCLLRQPAAARGSLNFAAVVGASLRLGCALPARRRDSSHATTSTGRGSTYLGRNAVSTKPATSARWIAQPPKAAFVTRLRPGQLPDQDARQLPDQSTTLWVDPSSTGDTRRRGALGNPGSDLS